MSDYYKSLITDDEVIKELLKESKRREGKLPTEVTRLKPNLNFFERTVNSLVSNNTRINKSQDTFKSEYLKDCKLEKLNTSEESSESPLKMSKIDYVFEREMGLQTKINFAKSSETFSSIFGKGAKKKIEIKKICFVKSSAGRHDLAGKRSGTETSNNKPIAGQISHNIPSRSECSAPSNDLVLILSDEEGKTTCKTISTKYKKTKLQQTVTNKLNENEVICISSDEGSIATMSSSSEGEDGNNKITTHIKKWKKNQFKEKFSEKLHKNYSKKSQKKKHKKKKKQKIDR